MAHAGAAISLRFPRADGSRRIAGMTLIEMLVVLAIIGILTAAAVTMVPGIQRSRELKYSATRVLDSFATARQESITSNCPIQIRIYTMGEKWFLKLFRKPSGQTSWESLGQVIKLDDAVTFSTNQTWSTLLTDAVIGNETPEPDGSTYRAFSYMPDGTTNLAGKESPVVTLLLRSDAMRTELPPNFITLQIDLQTGIVQTYQP